MPNVLVEQMGPFDTVLNPAFGHAALLATNLGLSPTLQCLRCGSQVMLRLWTNPQVQGGVVGQFVCPGCSAS